MSALPSARPTSGSAPTLGGTSGAIREFLGVVAAVSFEPLTAYVEWAEAVVESGGRDAVEYEVLFIPEAADVDVNNVTLAELRATLEGVEFSVIATTTDLSITVDGLESGETYVVLVVATTNLSESADRDGVVSLTIASRTPVLTDQTWTGAYASDTLTVELDDAKTTLSLSGSDVAAFSDYDLLVGTTSNDGQ